MTTGKMKPPTVGFVQLKPLLVVMLCMNAV